MAECIPVNLLETWIIDMTSILKSTSQEAKTQPDFWVNQGMRLGLAQIQDKITTWLRHQKYVQTRCRLGNKFLMVRRVNLSEGRYRNLEWYEDDLFVTLSWRHAKDAPRGELMLQKQHVQELSTTYLVYQGNLPFDDLMGMARAGGLDAIKKEEDWRQWVDKT